MHLRAADDLAPRSRRQGPTARDVCDTSAPHLPLVHSDGRSVRHRRITVSLPPGSGLWWGKGRARGGGCRGRDRGMPPRGVADPRRSSRFLCWQVVGIWAILFAAGREPPTLRLSLRHSSYLSRRRMRSIRFSFTIHPAACGSAVMRRWRCRPWVVASPTMSAVSRASSFGDFGTRRCFSLGCRRTRRTRCSDTPSASRLRATASCRRRGLVGFSGAPPPGSSRRARGPTPPGAAARPPSRAAPGSPPSGASSRRARSVTARGRPRPPRSSGPPPPGPVSCATIIFIRPAAWPRPPRARATSPARLRIRPRGRNPHHSRTRKEGGSPRRRAQGWSTARRRPRSLGGPRLHARSRSGASAPPTTKRTTAACNGSLTRCTSRPPPRSAPSSISVPSAAGGNLPVMYSSGGVHDGEPERNRPIGTPPSFSGSRARPRRRGAGGRGPARGPSARRAGRRRSRRRER